jgi:hypothetical protein
MFIVFVNLCMRLYVISGCIWTCMWIITVCDFRLWTAADIYYQQRFSVAVLEPLLITLDYESRLEEGE